MILLIDGGDGATGDADRDRDFDDGLVILPIGGDGGGTDDADHDRDFDDGLAILPFLARGGGGTGDADHEGEDDSDRGRHPGECTMPRCLGLATLSPLDMTGGDTDLLRFAFLLPRLSGDDRDLDLDFECPLHDSRLLSLLIEVNRAFDHSSISNGFRAVLLTGGGDCPRGHISSRSMALLRL